jgi:hypothetical protein
MPIPLPRQFFTTLQRTQIKLIINPNSKKTNTIVTVRNDQNLVVKIDGIINQHCKTAKPIRSIKKIQVCLTIELDMKNCTETKVNFNFLILVSFCFYLNFFQTSSFQINTLT